MKQREQNRVYQETLPSAALLRLLHQLPPALTPFIGREREYTCLLDRLYNPAQRLVTVIGPGGVGKTRLAVQAAQACTPCNDTVSPFTHGVYFVPLSTCDARRPLESTLATAIAAALDLPLTGPEDSIDQLRDYVREKALLLVLDNIEHLVASASFLMTLLRDAPHMKMLVTSRERLNLMGEAMVVLDGLDVPAPDQASDPAIIAQADSVRLFVQLARAMVSDFALTDQNAAAVVQICRLVEGLPLGIELAAHWSRVLSCADIAHEIAQNLDFLASTMHDLPKRHQSLRAVFASSWQLLTEAEQQTLRQLSVFRGGFTREAAATVTDASLPLLTALVDKSLVRRVVAGTNTVVRYEIPEVLRQYAFEQLNQAQDAAVSIERHATYYLEVLASYRDALRGAGQRAALDAIYGDIAQIRAAWDWAVQHGDSQQIGRCADALFHFYNIRSWFQEGADAFGQALHVLADCRCSGPAAEVRGVVLAQYGWFVFQLGRPGEACSLLEESLATLRAVGAQAKLVFTLNHLAAVYSYLGAYPRTQTLCKESLRTALELGDLYAQNVACNVLSQTAYADGSYKTAQVWSQQCLVLEQQIGNRWSLAFSLANLGKVVYALGNYDEASCLFVQSLQIRREMNDTRGVATCLQRLGDIAVAQNDLDQARHHYDQSLALFREIGNRWGMAATLTSLGQLALAQNNAVAASNALQEALRLALHLDALPQVLVIFTAFTRLMRQRGDTILAEELEACVANNPPTLELCRAHIERALTWSWVDCSTACSRVVGQSLVEGQAVSLPQAMALLADDPKTLVGAQSGITPSSKIQNPNPNSQPSTPNSQPIIPALAELTPRELEVLQLVAHGLTDAEVAEQLVLSRRTVSTHLSTIYSKLHVKSRSAATRLVLENGLV